jgi:hypothetical protein
MSESQPRESGLGTPEQSHSLQQQDPQPWTPVDQSQIPPPRSPGVAPPQVPQQYDPPGLQSASQAGSTGTTGLTAAERFWYILGNIAFGAMYLRKVPAKKAMSEFGLAEMTSAEKTWYTILCILCGAGYFAKLPRAKAISEMPRFVASGQGLTPAGTFWYILGCLAYGANYFSKVSAKKALSDFGLSELNGTEATWYTILCIACGYGYFAKIPTAKAVSEMPQFSATAQIPAAAHGS